MSALLRYADVLGHAGFAAFKESPARWAHKTANGSVSKCEDWDDISPFGSVRSAIVLNADGSLSYDRPAYSESRNVNIVAWGKDKDGAVKMAIICQPRPHADDPRNPGVDGHPPIVFGQIPMGFNERVCGKDMVERYETSRAAAARETAEETGASVILNITVPKVPWQNPNPTYTSTWSDILFVEVDLAMVEKLKHDRNEPIFSAEYVSPDELIRRIFEGEVDGAYYRGTTSLSAWLIFFANYREYFPVSNGPQR